MWWNKDGAESSTAVHNCGDLDGEDYNTPNIRSCVQEECHDTDSELCEFVKLLGDQDPNQNYCDPLYANTTHKAFVDNCKRTCGICKPKCIATKQFKTQDGLSCSNFTRLPDGSTKLDYYCRPRDLGGDAATGFAPLTDPHTGLETVQACPQCGECELDEADETGKGKNDGGYRFIVTAVQFSSETGKTIFAFTWMFFTNGMPTRGEWKVSLWFIPCAFCSASLCYLEFWVLVYLTATQYGIFYNIQIVFTALATWLFLHTPQSMSQWLAVMLVTVGCIQTNLCEIESSGMSIEGSNLMWGSIFLLLEIIAVVFWNIFCDKMFHKMENINAVKAMAFTSMYAMVLTFIMMWTVPGSADALLHSEGSFFHGWDGMTVLLVFMWVFYEFTSYLVIQNLSAVMLSMIGATCVVVTMIEDVLMFGTVITSSQIMACVVVVSGVALYHIAGEEREHKQKLTAVTEMVAGSGNWKTMPVGQEVGEGGGTLSADSSKHSLLSAAER